jgi:hypothetical protein
MCALPSKGQIAAAYQDLCVMFQCHRVWRIGVNIMKTLLLMIIAVGVVIMTLNTQLVQSFIEGYQLEAQREVEIEKCKKEPEKRWRDACLGLMGGN